MQLNHLTAIDAYTRHRNSAACYQLAQSVLKIGSALAERVGQGEVGGGTALAGSAWRLLQLAMEKAWSVLGVPRSGWQCMAAVAAGYGKGLVSAGCPAPPLSCTNEHRKPSFHLVGTPFLFFLGSFQSGGVLPGRRAQTIERSVLSGCGQGHEPAKNF